MKKIDYEKEIVEYIERMEQERLRLSQMPFVLEDVSTPYNLGNAKVNKPHDKLFKIVLGEKKQVVELLNRVLKPKKKLKEKDIEKYSTERISYRFQESEADIVYKIKNKEIFFLIEHQRTIDYNMPKRILDYELEIIREATRGKRMTKNNHKLPTVIPIVIYTGDKQWDVENYITDCQETIEGVKHLNLGEYIVIDANDFKNEELEQDDFFFSKMLLLEKLKTQEDIILTLDKMTQTEKDKNNRDILKRVIAFIMKDKLSEEETKELLEKLESEGKDMVMEVLQKESERQRRLGERKGRREGRLEGRLDIFKNMLKRNMKVDQIQEITGITKEELEKIQKILAKA